MQTQTCPFHSRQNNGKGVLSRAFDLLKLTSKHLIFLLHFVYKLSTAHKNWFPYSSIFFDNNSRIQDGESASSSTIAKVGTSHSKKKNRIYSRSQAMLRSHYSKLLTKFQKATRDNNNNDTPDNNLPHPDDIFTQIYFSNSQFISLSSLDYSSRRKFLARCTKISLFLSTLPSITQQSIWESGTCSTRRSRICGFQVCEIPQNKLWRTN
jgi:hypothetical protein